MAVQNLPREGGEKRSGGGVAIAALGVDGSYFQPLHRPAKHQVLLDDGVDVLFARIAVPDTLRVNHDSRTLRTAVHTTGLIDAHLTLTGEAKRLDPALGVIAHGDRALVGTARLAAFALIDAEKNVITVIGFGHG